MHLTYYQQKIRDTKNDYYRTQKVVTDRAATQLTGPSAYLPSYPNALVPFSPVFGTIRSQGLDCISFYIDPLTNSG